MLQIKNLAIAFQRYNSWFLKKTLCPVRSLNVEVEKGRIMAIVGESGAGKSLLAHAILGLLPANADVSGEILYKGKPMTISRIRQLRGREIALVPQSMGFLNPLWCTGAQVARAARLSGKSRKAAKAARDRAFERYELDSHVKAMFPFQISGGMARRVLTASATAGNAELIIADEPTNGLDEQKSRHSLNFLKHLAMEGKAVLLITHDIQAALEVADHVTVFHNGVTVEMAGAADFSDPSLLRHPYTRELFSALPGNSFTGAVNGKGPCMQGSKGCLFCGTCPTKQERCANSAPPTVKIRNGWVRCHHAAG